MAELRQRKPADPAPARIPEPDDDKKKSQPAGSKRDAPDLEPSLAVMVALLTSFFGLLVLFFTYKESHAHHGAFAGYINARFPAVEALLNRPLGGGGGGGVPLFGAAAADVPASSTVRPALTETELAAYDGTDPDLPLLLAINGTVYDVSASPSFYGPGGHYHHFVGRDASRAWVTECWDDPEQLTWRMDGIEAMFTPTWLDEQLETAAAGQLDPAVLGELGKKLSGDVLANMAKKAIERFGTVSEEEKVERRASDRKEAEERVQETLGRWVGFFSKSDKYSVYGTVVLEEKPEPPAPCPEAMKKRAIKGGKLESMMGTLGKMMGGGAGEKKEGAPQMPDFVKQQLEKAKAKLGKEGSKEEDTVKSEDPVHEEL